MAKTAQELLTDIPHVNLSDVADRLGVEESRVKQLVKERRVLALDGDEGLQVLEQSLVELPPEEQYATEVSDRDSEGMRLVRVTDEPLPSLRGTVTVLEDGGYSNEELIEWLWTDNPYLEGKPIDFLRSGERKAVNRLAASQSW